MYMKIIITERQYSIYLKRRYHCLREYIDQLVKYEKKFLIIGNINAITYKEIFKKSAKSLSNYNKIIIELVSLNNQDLIK